MILNRDFFKTSERSNAGVVDPNIDVSKLRNGHLRNLLDILPLADIGRHNQRPHTHRLALIRQLVEQFFATRRQYNRSASKRKLQRSTLPEAARGSRYDNHLSVQFFAV